MMKLPLENPQEVVEEQPKRMKTLKIILMIKSCYKEKLQAYCVIDLETKENNNKFVVLYWALLKMRLMG